MPILQTQRVRPILPRTSTQIGTVLPGRTSAVFQMQAEGIVWLNTNVAAGPPSDGMVFRGWELVDIGMLFDTGANDGTNFNQNVLFAYWEPTGVDPVTNKPPTSAQAFLMQLKP